MTKLILLGTGTPNSEYNAYGASYAIVVKDKVYLVDFGSGVIRQASKAYMKGIKQLKPSNIDTAFLTHLHSDHTIGIADLILTPWVLERKNPLNIYGPKNTDKLVSNILKAFEDDIEFRKTGKEQANTTGIIVNTHQVLDNYIYKDDYVRVKAIRVTHGTLESYAYKFYIDNKTILISGDTSINEKILEESIGVDILVHEVEYEAGLKQREPKWQEYHKSVHTMSSDLGKMCSISKPKLLITTHRIYHIDFYNDNLNIEKEIKEREEFILDEIRNHYNGNVINGHDLDVFDI